MVAVTFDPDWVVAPGEILREWMEENGLGPRVAAKACDMWPSLFVGVMDAAVPITEPIAQALGQGTGISASLWLNLERAYRPGLAAGKIDASCEEAPS